MKLAKRLVVLVAIAVIVAAPVEARHRRHRHRPPPPPVDPTWSQVIGWGTAYWGTVGTPVFPQIVEAAELPPPCQNVPGDQIDGCGYLHDGVCDVFLRPEVLAWDGYTTEQLTRFAAHELGHCLGFAHEPYEGYAGVMVAGSLLRTPRVDDDARLCAGVENC